MPKKKKPKKISYERVRYEVDSHNKLVISQTDRKTKLPRFRRVLTGRFKTNKNNSLTYLIKIPVSRKLGILGEKKSILIFSRKSGHNEAIVAEGAHLTLSYLSPFEYEKQTLLY